jgi:hypothetical protein
MAVARSAAEKVMFLAPGMLFVPDRSAQPRAMRVNAAYASDQGRRMRSGRLNLAG